MKNDGRARRFALHLPLRYRPIGAEHWREGRIENISRSGVLFWTDDPMGVDTRVEMSFVLPLNDDFPAVVCRGHIVRAVPLKEHQGTPALAATISAYRFVRGTTAA